MAGASDNRNVQVNLTANVSAYQRAMQDAATATNVALVGVTKLAKATDNLVKRAGRKIALVGVSDIAGLTAAAEASNRLDQSLTQVRATSAVTGQSVGALRNQVMSLSRTIPDSTNNIARLVGQIQALGVQGTANISNLTVTAERLAAATNTAPGDLFQSIFQLNRQMGNGLQTLNQYSSALVGLSKQTGTSASDITGFATSISSVAQSAGYTETQILGLAAAFARAGADSAGAANVFTTLTSEINQAVVTGSAQLKVFGDLVGSTANQFQQMAKTNPAKTFTDVLNAIQNQGQGGILTLQQLGLDGPRALRVISALTGGQANLSQSMGLANQAYAKNADLTKSSNAAWDDLSSTMQKFRNNIDDIVVRLGGPMAHALNIMFEAVNSVVGPLNSFLGMLGPIPGIVAGIGGAFLAVTGTITAFSVAILAAAGAWRALSGMTGTNSLQGFTNGLRGSTANPQTIFRRRPIDMTRRSGAANWIFGQSAALGGRFAAPPPEDPNLFQRAMGRAGAFGRAVVTYPGRRLGWEAREAMDTLRPGNLFNYENRDNSKVNPYSVLGFMQATQRGGTRAAGAVGDIQGRLSELLGKTGFGMGPKLKVDADVQAAATKIDELRKTASAPVQMPVGASGSGIGAFVRSGPGVAAGLESEAAGASRMGLMGLAGRGIGGAVNAMGTLASVFSSVALPVAVFGGGIAIATHYLSKLRDSAQNAANNMDDFGTQLAQTAGANYIKPTTTPNVSAPSDRVNPFGTQERTTATAGTFLSGNSKDIGQLRSYSSNRVGAAQLMVQNVIANANSGQSLTTSEQTTLREQLIAAYGAKNAQNIYNRLNLSGLSASAQARLQGSLLGGTKDDSGFFQRSFQGTKSAAQIMNAVTPIANSFATDPARAGLGLVGLQQALRLPSGSDLAYLHAAANGTGRSRLAVSGIARQYSGIPRLQNAASDIVTQLNKGQSGSDLIHINSQSIFTVQDFVNQLKDGSPRAKELAANLSRAGLNLNDLNGSVTKLTQSMTNAAGQQAIDRTARTAIARQSSAMGFSLADTSNVDYASNIAKLTFGNERTNSGQRSLTDPTAIQNAINQWRRYEMTISSASPQFDAVQQAIAGLNSQLQAQQSIFMTTAQSASYYADQAGSMIDKFGTHGDAGNTEQDLINQAQAGVAASESTLKGYVMQVHEAHIQMAQGEADFNLQMSHMYRDFNIQQKEAFYQRNQQLRESNYQFMDQLRSMKFQTAQVFGNPTSMVQAQYTMGAGSALTGLHQQNALLAQSQSTIDQLHRMGVSRNVIRVLGLDDPNNVEQAQRYLADFGANPKLIDAFNNSIKNRLKISNGLDTDVNNSKFHDMQRSFNHSAELATKAFNHSQQQTQDAFDRELSDFTTQYNISVSREMQQLSEIGQNLYTSWASLDKAAMQTGLKNIQNYAKGIGVAMAKVKHDTNAYVKSTQAAVHGNEGGHIVTPGAGNNRANPGIGGTGTGTSFKVRGGQMIGGRMYLSGESASDRKFIWSELKQESGNYSAHNSAGAMGAYQILASNIPSWSKEALGHSISVNTFMNNPRLQDKIAQFKFMQYVRKYGYAGAAASWYAGEGNHANINDNSPQYGGPSIHDYVQSVLGRMGHAPANLSAHHRHHHHAAGHGHRVSASAMTTAGTPFSAHVMRSAARKSGISSSAYDMSRTTAHSSPVYRIDSINNTYDHSSTFSGNWTVVAQDPNEMARKLEAKKRLAALTKPKARR